MAERQGCGASWGLGRAWAAYGLAALLTCLAVAWALRLWEADLSVPFSHHSDALLVQAWVKTLIERGWYLHSDALGAPNGLDMHDFPLVDSLFFALLKVVSLAAGDAARTLNVYYLLTFPLVAVTALGAMRRLGVSYGPAVVAAVLLAVAPYHFSRSLDHLFLASYFLLPPMVVVLLGIYPGRAEPEPEASGGRLRGLRRDLGPGAVAVCTLMGCGGVYYAFFSCYLLLVAGLAAAVQRRRFGPLAGAAVLVGVIVAAVAANLAPHLVYDAAHGPNPRVAHRSPLESEIFGLRVAYLLAPVKDHRLGALARLREMVDRELPGLSRGEVTFSPLGMAAAAGFLLLLGRLVAPRRAGRAPGVMDGLALLNLAALLLAMAGGLGTVFNLVVSPMIRCYNRMSIFIACFSLIGLAMAADRVGSRLRGGAGRAAWWAALAAALVGGVWDQTSRHFVPPYAQNAELYAGEAEFVRGIEAVVPDGGMVFQLPSLEFPEPGVALGAMGAYDPLRCYMHSRRVRWSHGVMKGRPGDLWRAWTAEQPAEELAETLAYAGFSGIHVNRSGYADRGAEVERLLAEVLGSGPRVESRGEDQAFYDLSACAARLRAGCGAAEWATRREAALRPVFARYGAGFAAEEPGSSERWAGSLCAVQLFNPGPDPCRAALAMRCIGGEPARLRVRGPGWEETLEIDGTGLDLERTLVLPPGMSRVRLLYQGPAGRSPQGVFRVAGLTLRRDPSAIAAVGGNVSR